MQTVKASEFKAKCLALMDAVALSGETLCITKHGKPLVELRPIKSEKAKSPFGWHKGKVTTTDDLIEPAVPLEDWDALR
jgi:prevent-host-death family protein